MMSINQILNRKPSYILSYDSSSSLGDMLGDESNNEYLAELIIQYHSISLNACLAFTIECLISVDDNQTSLDVLKGKALGVTIEQMDTCCDTHNVYVNNIASLPDGSHYVWSHDIDESLHDTLVELIESQPIDTVPEHFTVEVW